MKIVTVLRQSREYTTSHAQWLHQQLPNYDTLCLTDASYIRGVDTAPLLFNWPGWFSKIELFNPNHPVIGQEDILFLDLDTVIVGDISPFLLQRKFTTLTDFYNETSPLKPMASAVMYIPANSKSSIWDAFIQCPDEHINSATKMPFHGDQGVIGKLSNPERWQDILPGMVVSYKKHIACKGMNGFVNSFRSQGNGNVPVEARIVCFHGKPRPWEVRCDWIPIYLTEETS